MRNIYYLFVLLMSSCILSCGGTSGGSSDKLSNEPSLEEVPSVSLSLENMNAVNLFNHVVDTEVITIIEGGVSDNNDPVSDPISNITNDISIHNDVAFTHLGEGECRQSDGDYPATFSIGYWDLSPHTEGNNAEIAKNRCKSLCSRYSWCVAAEVVVRDIWETPECGLITDSDTFLSADMTFQSDSWAGLQTIDGLRYQTYCGGGGESCSTRDIGLSPKLGSREGYHCYVNNNVVEDVSSIVAGVTTTEDGVSSDDSNTRANVFNQDQNIKGDTSIHNGVTFTPLGEGECRQFNYEYPAKFSIGYDDLSPHTEGNNAQIAKDRCQSLCSRQSWCVAAEVVVRDIWETPECRLVTDGDTFASADMTFEHNDYSGCRDNNRSRCGWGNIQNIDGLSYQSYCGGGWSDCSARDIGPAPRLNPREGYHCYINDNVVDDAAALTDTALYNGVTFTDLGEGECRQSDGAYPAKFSIGFLDLSPHTKGNNAQVAKDRCQSMCSRQSWCLAAEVVVRDSWETPECRLVTDGETFQSQGKIFEHNDYSGCRDNDDSRCGWGKVQSIDGLSYQSYCGGGWSDCSTRDIGTGLILNERPGYHCYSK